MAITGELKKAITFSQLLQVDGVNAVNLTASINSSAPSNYSMASAILSQPLYREHRAELDAMRAAFEAAVWAAVDEMTSAGETTENEEE